MLKVLVPPIIFNIVLILIYLVLPLRVLHINYIVLVSLTILFAILRSFELFLAVYHNNKVENYETVYDLKAAAIIPALLTTEQDIILDTLKHFRSLPYPDLKVYLTYNTPKSLPVEKELRKLEKEWDNLMVIKVEGSITKAENINKALEYIDSDFVGIFDADHKPEKDAFEKADYYFQNSDYEIIQGRCISLADKSLLSKLVSLDVDQMYGINHFSRELMYGFAIFGGSNGYWKTDILKELKFNPNMLTEDIDISVRAIKKDYKIKYLRDIISYELPPKDMDSFVKQRTRWAQGWLQATLHNSKDIFYSTIIQMKQKIGILFIFPIRELRTYLITQTFAIALAYGIRTGYWDWTNSKYFVLFILLTIISALEPIFVFMTRNKTLQRRWIIFFSVFNPLYTYLLHSTTLMGMVRLLQRNHHFEVTHKQKRKD